MKKALLFVVIAALVSPSLVHAQPIAACTRVEDHYFVCMDGGTLRESTYGEVLFVDGEFTRLRIQMFFHRESDELKATLLLFYAKEESAWKFVDRRDLIIPERTSERQTIFLFDGNSRFGQIFAEYMRSMGQKELTIPTIEILPR